MNTKLFVERLHEDESLTSALNDLQATRLFSWAEVLIEAFSTDEEVLDLFDTIRALNRSVEAGASFDDCWQMIRFRSDLSSSDTRS